MARPAGIHADTSAVKMHISAAASSPHGVITRYMLTFSPLPSKKPKESRRHHSVIPIPAHPASIPSGIPIAQSTSASYMTVPRNCLRVAPIDLSIPNWRVRSLTDIENELYISETEPQNIMSTRIITIP